MTGAENDREKTGPGNRPEPDAGPAPGRGEEANLNNRSTLRPGIKEPPGRPNEPVANDRPTVRPGAAEAVPPRAVRPESGERPPPAPRSVERVGDYELLERIAQGGMGVVYKARDTKLKRYVALKMIKSGERADAEDVKRFRREAKAAARLDHPNIVPVYEAGEHAGLLFFAMALVEGKSLAHRLARGPLPPREAAALVRAVAEAVAHAHARGVIHRDLKPSNILLDPDGRPRVTDFGIARCSGVDVSLRTVTGAMLGTPGYMAPEQVAGRLNEIGPASDVFGLGAVLYAALLAQPPFAATNLAETLSHVLTDGPVPPRQLNPSVPADLEVICLKCLRKRPAERYGSAGMLAEELRRFLGGEALGAPPSGAVRAGGRFGDYELLEELARGSVGVVFKARQRSSGRTVALKMIRAGELAIPEEVQHLRAESDALARLEHPGIVSVLEVGEGYYAMEFVEGKRLTKMLARGPLPPESAAKLTREVAEAVAHAHERGVFHNNLGPDNILLDLDGRLRVIDFGAAKAGRNEAGPATDVEALGRLLHTLLFGHPPVPGANLSGRLGVSVPNDLKTICRNCLEGGRSRRYATGQAVADDLRRFEAGQPPVRGIRRGLLSRIWPRLSRWRNERDHNSKMWQVSNLFAGDLVLVLLLVGLLAALMVLIAYQMTLRVGSGNSSNESKAAEAEIRKLDRGGLAYVQLGQYDRAVTVYSQLINRQPRVAWHWLGRGQCYAQQARWQDAAADYAKAYQIQPHLRPWDWLEHAYLLLQTSDTGGYRRLCMEMLDRFGEAEQEDPLAYLAHTCLLSPDALGDRGRVVQIAQRPFKEVRALRHRKPSYHVLALAHYRAGQYAEAIEAVRKATELDPNRAGHVRNWQVLAMAHHGLGQVEEARQWLEKAKQRIDRTNQNRPKESSRFAPPSWLWRDWLGCQMLQSEAEMLLKK